MKKLNQLLERISYTCIQGSIDTEVTDIVNDSRKITPGCLFFCIPGAVTDGHKFAAQAAEQGAAVLVVSKEVEVPDSVTVIRVRIPGMPWRLSRRPGTITRRSRFRSSV